MTANLAIGPLPPRARFQGVRQIVRFNWPRYAGATGAIAAATIAIMLLPLPGAARAAAAFSLALAAWWILVSLAASHWVYDRSRLYRWDWLPQLLPATPARWVNVHSGFDETTLSLRAVLKSDPLAVLDIFDPAAMTEPSIARARALHPPPWPATAGAGLPSTATDLDAAFLILAAHELRTPAARAALLAGIAARLSPEGRIIVVEHLRDAANFIAFGPGFTHFHSRRTWLRDFAAARLVVERQIPITPLLRASSLRRTP